MARDPIDVKDWEFDNTYTSEPIPMLKPWDGSTPIDIHKWAVARYLRCEEARRNKMLLAEDAEGRTLYVLSNSGALKRRFVLSKSRKERVRQRDGNRCVWCNSPERLEVDHIVRYIDGGGNDMTNLRTLCHDCHTKRGGRA